MHDFDSFANRDLKKSVGLLLLYDRGVHFRTFIFFLFLAFVSLPSDPIVTNVHTELSCVLGVRTFPPAEGVIIPPSEWALNFQIG